MKHTTVGAVVLTIGVLLNITRGIFYPDITKHVPVWLSSILLLLFGGLTIAYLLFLEDHKGGDMVVYLCTIAVFFTGFVVHVLRIAMFPTILDNIPVLLNQLFIPITALLAYYNWKY